MTMINRRLFTISLVASAAASFPLRAAATGAGKDPLWYVDPELRSAARELIDLFNFSDATLPAIRAEFEGLTSPPLKDMPYARRVIAGPHGSAPLVVYVINAKPGQRRAGILHTHGGGFVIGSAASSVRPMQDIAAELDCTVVTVEYRLAPETRYDGSTEDNYSALRWLYDHAEELGVDRGRIGVMGESAGGGHAALLAIRARDRGEVPLAFQCLVCPMLDDRTGSTRAVAPYIGTILWTPKDNRYGWRSFLGMEPGGSHVPAEAVPARVTTLSGLPPTWIGVGSIDLFASEDIEYARRLLEAGVPTELLVTPGAYHGFDAVAASTGSARRFNAAKMQALRRGLAGA